LEALALAEAAIDFVDEGDLPEDLVATLLPEVADVRREVAAHLADRSRGERLREGVEVAIVGPPNAGKSSLLNRLARREAAIVTDIPGTTRDIVEVRLDLGGYPALLADTAGLREATTDAVETEGVRRALARAATADLKLALFDGAIWPELDRQTLALVDDDTVLVVNKADLGHVPATPEIGGREAIALSCVTGAGLSPLLERVESEVRARAALTEAPALTRARHREALEDCEAALGRAAAAAGAGAAEPELLAEDLRLAARAIGRITGRVTVDEVLDVIFSRFCIGK
jgi:tRNA modification GTPase